ncbi:MAG: putative multidrug resistance ABC transporter ATP-binding/permease protein YheI [bacterium ADurb.Bin243]|nr:MAG: putative multidrug resistance ABC transporter ATP-binding/permease protein YheI [bacterium ADurb.Bin243]HOD40569.1 ABC transporter ATP-binding protein [Candidatus Wallbacteria bacterium]
MFLNKFKPIHRHLINYRKEILIGALSLVVTDCFGLAIPWIIKDAIDAIPAYKTAGAEKTLAVVFNYSLLIVFAAVFQGAFRYVWRVNLFGVARKIEYHLRNDYFSHLLKLEPSFYFKNQTGDIISRGTNDLNAVRDLVGPGALIFIDTITLISISLSLMIYIDWKLTLYCLMPMPLLTIVIYFVGDLIERTYERMQQKLAELTTRVQENITGIRTIQAFRQEENEIRRFSKMAKDYVKYNVLMAKVNGIEEPIIFFISGTSMNVLLYFGGMGVINKTNSLGELVALSGYLMLLAWPLFGLGWLVNIYKRGIASMGRINEILEAVPEISDGEETDTSIPPLRGDIEFKNVSFTFPGKKVPALKNVSFKVPAGRILAITGPLGSGKSTICNLIPRFLEAAEGEVLIDSVNVKKIPVSLLRRSIGYIRQEPFLFSDTIAENLKFGDPAASQERIREFCSISRIVEDIEDFSEKYETLLGERGITVSGGQKQRLAISRALLKNPNILIFDDTLSAVDNRTEEAIIEGLEKFMKDSTAIIVSHRISSIMNADEIIVVDNGEIVERGTHQSLIAGDGIYAKTYQKQKLKFEIENMQVADESV